MLRLTYDPIACSKYHIYNMKFTINLLSQIQHQDLFFLTFSNIQRNIFEIVCAIQTNFSSETDFANDEDLELRQSFPGSNPAYPSQVFRCKKLTSPGKKHSDGFQLCVICQKHKTRRGSLQIQCSVMLVTSTIIFLQPNIHTQLPGYPILKRHQSQAYAQKTDDGELYVWNITQQTIMVHKQNHL